MTTAIATLRKLEADGLIRIIEETEDLLTSTLIEKLKARKGHKPVMANRREGIDRSCGLRYASTSCQCGAIHILFENGREMKA